MTTSAREVVAGVGARSMTRTGTPCRASSLAMVNPVGARADHQHRIYSLRHLDQSLRAKFTT